MSVSKKLPQKYSEVLIAFAAVAFGLLVGPTIEKIIDPLWEVLSGRCSPLPLALNLHLERARAYFTVPTWGIYEEPFDLKDYTGLLVKRSAVKG